MKSINLESNGPISLITDRAISGTITLLKIFLILLMMMKYQMLTLVKAFVFIYGGILQKEKRLMVSFKMFLHNQLVKIQLQILNS